MVEINGSEDVDSCPSMSRILQPSVANDPRLGTRSVYLGFTYRSCMGRDYLTAGADTMLTF